MRYTNRCLLLMALLFMTNLMAAPIDWPLVSLDGRQSNLTEYQGRWAIVNIWATWCPSCVEELPELVKFYKQHSDRAVVIGVNMEEIDTERIAEFAASYAVNYPLFHTPPAAMTPLGPVPALPITFLVSPQGELVARRIGPVTGEMLNEFIQSWEASRNPPQQ